MCVAYTMSSLASSPGLPLVEKKKTCEVKVAELSLTSHFFQSRIILREASRGPGNEASLVLSTFSLTLSSPL